MQAEDILANDGLFHGLSREELKGVGLRVKTRDFAVGEAALQEGQISPGVFFILEGSFEISKRTPDGTRKVVLATLHKGEFFGEIEFLDGSPAHASVVALEASRVGLIEYRQFLEIKNTNPQTFILIVLNMARTLGRRLRKKGDELVSRSSAQ